MSEPTLIIGSFVQQELFAGAGISPSGQFEDGLVMEAFDWLEANVVEIEREGRLGKGVTAESIYKWLGSPDSNYRRWWRRLAKARNWKLGTNFVCLTKMVRQNEGRGGHNAKQEILTIETAREVMASDASPRGRAMLRGLLLLAQKYRNADQGMIVDMILRQTDAEFLASISDLGMRRSCLRWLEQGKSLEWVQDWYAKRCDLKMGRNLFTQAAHSHGCTAPTHFALITDAVYKSLGYGSTKELRKEHHLGTKQTPRNRFDLLRLFETGLTEIRSADAMDKLEADGFQECREIAADEGRRVAASRRVNAS